MYLDGPLCAQVINHKVWKNKKLSSPPPLYFLHKLIALFLLPEHVCLKKIKIKITNLGPNINVCDILVLHYVVWVHFAQFILVVSLKGTDFVLQGNNDEGFCQEMSIILWLLILFIDFFFCQFGRFIVFSVVFLASWWMNVSEYSLFFSLCFGLNKYWLVQL